MIIDLNTPSYFFPELALIILFFVIAISTILPGIHSWSRRYFISFYTVLALNGIIFMFDMMVYMHPEKTVFYDWIPLIEYLLLPIPIMIISFYIVHCFGENLKDSLISRTVIPIWLFYCVQHIIAHFTTFFYYSTPDGRFFIKSSVFILYIPIIAILLFVIFTLIKRRKELPRRYVYAFLFFFVPVTIAIIVHSICFSITAINIASIIGSFAMYILILTDQIEQYSLQQAAIANQEASIMILKMRPHFIYNTMTSIYYLCDQDPKKAQKVILDFTSYLRKNFNALVTNDTVPFSEEYEHVRAYLAVELAQFEDNLTVDYDIEHTQFKLPPLTLQPIVENAIKHCMDPDSEPLHILIKTSKTDTGSTIIVKDNGPGFDTKDVFNSNSALSNIKKRLRIMCHGTITIISNINEGTTVEVFIP